MCWSSTFNSEEEEERGGKKKKEGTEKEKHKQARKHRSFVCLIIVLFYVEKHWLQLSVRIGVFPDSSWSSKNWIFKMGLSPVGEEEEEEEERKLRT